jgi:hypothetical protein
MNEELDAGAEITEGAAGAPEGTAAAQPTADDVEKMYKELGIKAPKPTDKSSKRPKTSTVRAKDAKADDDSDAKSGRKDDDTSKTKSKDAQDSDKDGAAGNDTDAKGAKVSKASGKVPEQSEETDEGVHKAKSRTEEDAKSGSESDTDEGDERASDDDESEESEEGKRPGKSNPKVEQRFQRLTEEKRAAEQRAEELQKQLQEKEQAVQQAKISQEDPEYTIEDFAKVRDENGNILDLDPERAELAWRRWQDGYNQRAEQRNAEANRQAELERAQSEYSENIMRQSVEAYDSLAGLMDEYPELVSSSGKFDAEFAAVAMPIINDAIVYQEGTEPGNAEGNQAVIMGLKINPKQILDGMKKIQAAKRSLPLNGLNDNVEVRSNVNVQHSRSSDPTVNAANELYKELNINKRL